MTLKGIGASKGIAIAKVFELKHHEIKIEKKSAKPDIEVKRIEDAINQTITQIEKITAKLREEKVIA